MKSIFMGTPEFSVPVLDALAQRHEIVAVYTQPPRPAGRGKADRISPVHARALTLGLQVRHPVSLRSEDVQHDFAALGADVAVVVAYGLIPSEMADQLALDPDVALAIGFALTAFTEGAYALAKRLGWAT